jgi:zinc transporter, ZIP family
VKSAAAAIVLAAAAVGCGGASPDELQVTQASLSSGHIALVVHNASDQTERLAQVIVNDSFVDFRTSNRTVPPDDVEAIVLSYPWIAGESYDIELMTATGRTVDYEVEDAEAS